MNASDDPRVGLLCNEGIQELAYCHDVSINVIVVFDSIL